MTLDIHLLNELKRRETDSPQLQPLPVDFPHHLRGYLHRTQDEAGPHPAAWDADCEALAAMGVLEDLFRARKDKIFALARDEDAPPAEMLDFEREAWTLMRFACETLDRGIRETIIPKRKVIIEPVLTVTFDGRPV